MVSQLPGQLDKRAADFELQLIPGYGVQPKKLVGGTGHYLNFGRALPNGVLSLLQDHRLELAGRCDD
jgi:hypothetical protein